MAESVRSFDTGSEIIETHEIRPEWEAGRTWAVEVQDDGEPRRVLLGRAPVVLGSSRSSGAIVHDRTVSARHCELSAGDRGVLVRDLGSRNGTYVGGARVEKAVAAEGTTITIGKTTLVCVTVDEEDEDMEPVPPLPGLAGTSRAMRRIAAQVRRLARLSAPVLVSGETGVGKELVARALHTEGARRDGPFVAMNVASLPRELVESELFGHERGAFTGAVARRQGAFTEAEAGTLFLDEIGELPLDAQPKLLRALDGYEVRRVGAAGPGHRATARVVVATHVPLQEHVLSGGFRRDLFHRLEVFVVDVPPLRERPGDIGAIAKKLLGQLESEIGRRDLTPAALAKLTVQPWPGNVRELRNVLLRAADVARSGRWLDSDAIERATRKRAAVALSLIGPEVAREHLGRHDGNVSAAARAAGVPRTTFRKALKPGPRKT
ncbi:MAG: sigma 54-interacting transcriptional regulator [Deltaproteobacteria bacterium]|nr:sigma 54-interacting transcriptional regulator [Deltaproteobacteria bacterium]